jgi:hypothetical protein
MSPCLKTLFSRCVQRRVRLHTMTISMEVTDISGAPGEQLSLFEPPPLEPTPRHRLALALDRVRDRFGERAIRYGR